MHLKRYRGGTVRDALALARGELGRNALVLSTRLVPCRGVKGWLGVREVELTAAADRDMSRSRPVARRADTESDVMELIAAPSVESRDPIVARLCATGLNRELAERIAADLPRSQRRATSRTALADAVARHLGPMAAADKSYARVEVFVGPPGAGKTTTIAKIAAQERVRRGKKLRLVAADGFRVGAVEQLRLYAGIIGSPFAVARTADEIDASLEGERGPVLVDTAGRSLADERALETATMLAGRPGVRTHLVVPAASSVRDLDRLLDTYQDCAHRVVLTRLDEAESVSPLLNVLGARGVPVSYLGTGQRVPEDLELATPLALARHVVGCEGGDASSRPAVQSPGGQAAQSPSRPVTKAPRCPA